jgi:hypothetical protein
MPAPVVLRGTFVGKGFPTYLLDDYFFRDSYTTKKAAFMQPFLQVVKHSKMEWVPPSLKHQSSSVGISKI